jgi:hypothetical protein
VKTKLYMCGVIAWCLVPPMLRSEDSKSSISHEVVFLHNNHDLSAPINFSGAGVQHFIQQVFNRPVYAQDLLPNDFRHMLQLLHHGATSASSAYARSVLKLFTNKIKGASYVNAYAFANLLKHCSQYLAPYLQPTPLISFEPLKKQINDVLYASFLNKFDQFKQDPDHFFVTVSDAIINDIKVAPEFEGVSHKHVQQAFYRFVDVCMNKLIWSPQDHEAVWPIIKDIAGYIEHLTENNCLADFDDVDDLYWSLIHRLCFFIDIASPDLPVCFYEIIKRDLTTNSLLLCDLEEQEEHLETKGQHLMQALLAGEAKARLRAEEKA